MRLPTGLVIQHSAGDGLGRLGDWLREAGLLLDVLRPDQGQAVPAALDGYAAVIVLGGAMSAWDDAAAPWLPATRDLLRAATAAGVPVLGVCLGAQLLASALGGRVERGGSGPEIGPALIAKRDVAAHDRLFRPVPFTPDVLQWHWDAITSLPPDATLLASSTRYPHQAFRVRERTWGVQFHLETTADMVRRWAAEDAAALADVGIDVAALLARRDLDEVHADLAEVWQPFAVRFVEVVREAEYAARA
ncbi:MAG TPA: type 1 glutamine amidotransferase [Mycobacteriales bacterium]|nr:type 1 glutamine amidotransferase [Mycobacteriales bacterium]